MGNEPIWLTEFILKKQRNGVYIHHLRVVDKVVTFRTDNNLGSITSGASAAFKELLYLVYPVDQCKPTPTALTGSDVNLSNYELKPLLVWPWRWCLVMEVADKDWKFECNLDSNLESILAGYSAALKFFAVKSGQAILFPEVIRAKDTAHEHGFMKDDIERSV